MTDRVEDREKLLAAIQERVAKESTPGWASAAGRADIRFLLSEIQRLRKVEEAAKEVAAGYHEHSAGKDGPLVKDYCLGCGDRWPCAAFDLRTALSSLSNTLEP